MTRISTVATLSGGALVVATALLAGAVPGVVALAGLGGVALGVRRASGGLVTRGTVALLGAVLLTGTEGLDPGFVLLGTLGAVLSWDAGTTAVELTEQLSPAETARAEVVRLGATAVAVSLLAGLTYLVSLLGRGSLPPFSALLLLAGAGLLAYGVVRWSEP